MTYSVKQSHSAAPWTCEPMCASEFRDSLLGSTYNRNLKKCFKGEVIWEIFFFFKNCLLEEVKIRGVKRGHGES